RDVRDAAMSRGDARGARRLRGALNAIGQVPVVQMLALIGLYSYTALRMIRKFAVLDPDIWWHMATGRWILQHHALPVTDPFSMYGATRAWLVYSWAFDVGVQALLARFGLVGIFLLQVAVHVLVAVAFYHLVKSLLPDFWRGVALTAVSLYAISLIYAPRPGMATVLFTILELGILLAVHRGESARKLWLLPLIFVAWANIHIQFVYGLGLLGVFACEPIAMRVLRLASDEETGGAFARAKYFWAALGGCLLATFVNPYGPRLFATVIEYMHQPKSYSLVVELKAMTFRQPEHYVAAFLALCAAVAIGWRRERRPLWAMLLAISAFVAFRSVKEIWFLSVIAACAIADGWTPSPVVRQTSVPAREVWRNRIFVGAGVLAVLLLAYRNNDVSNDWIAMQVAGSFPEASVGYIEKHHLPGPLYNDFTWGGYLIWRLPQLRVANDGRTNVHGDARVEQDAKVWNGKPGWDLDPELAAANLIVADKKYALTELLRRDGRFRLVFEDKDATVFVSAK
ncbi:MAG TPA: hypothetical protein VN933_14410, partial [Candidatus Eremiobacteraceae bacterium]|nr:hypothetical protein [Candidatus Eremiobacteraceae bacterium]